MDLVQVENTQFLLNNLGSKDTSLNDLFSREATNPVLKFKCE